MFAPLAASQINLRNKRIENADADRQTRAARELLERLDRQPGVILADEVGMGKTFVALAVAASVLLERPHKGPVVVMSPPSLRHKWPKDWQVFKTECLNATSRNTLRSATAESGVEFLQLLDDPPDRRAHVIFLTHGALNRTIGDGLAKLAVLKRAFKGRSSLSKQKRAFGRWAGRLLRMEWVEARSPGLLARLLDRHHSQWLGMLQRADDKLREKFTDDPVPRHLAEALDEMRRGTLDPLVEALRYVPLRESANLDERLQDVRRALAAEMDAVWQHALRKARFRSPLLVLDEAHHVKNPATRLASLFMTPDAEADSRYVTEGGPLAGKFDRMLFLTATPFQLGHAELIRVLERFDGVAWKGTRAPSIGRSEFTNEIRALGQVLDDAQAAALRLDRAWGRLTSEHVGTERATVDDVDGWWQTAKETEGEGIEAQVVAQVAHTREAMKHAEKALAPWVLRHVRSDHLPGATDLSRRLVFPGAAIRGDGYGPGGLEIPPEVLLPFLLAGRAQGLLAASSKGRALFAEGLASSFEAYLETRANRPDIDEDGDLGGVQSAPQLEWYLGQLDRALPRHDRSVRSAHPKIRATAERAVDLWAAGEKVLIFCHYRATGRALRQHISAALYERVLRLGQDRLPGKSSKEVQARLEEIGDQFFDDARLRDRVTSWLDDVVGQFNLNRGDREEVVEVFRRFLRTPAFLVRYFPLESTDPTSALADALEATHAGESLQQRVEEFCRCLVERCIPEERADLLDALKTVQTGTHSGKDVRAESDPAEQGQVDESMALQPNVRLANGDVKDETRRRLLLTFNTPLFPEILIASSVLAEGVDLHLYCRYVIHHDLCWNPSTLEQRSGRVDRIGCCAERVVAPIHLYLPYVAATQDEKMFRVVRDRERWFQIVMGETYEIDEAATDRRAERMPLPAALQAELSMKLFP